MAWNGLVDDMAGPAMAIRYNPPLLQGGQHLMWAVSEKAEIDYLVTRAETLPDLVGHGVLIRHALAECEGISKEGHTGQGIPAFAGKAVKRSAAHDRRAYR